MGIENLPSHIPPQRTANGDVRDKMLVAHPPRDAHSSGNAVGQKLGKRAWIFMSNDAGNGPTHGSVRGRKRISSHEEPSRAGANKRPFPARCIFEEFRIEECANRSFSSQEPSLAFLIVLLEVPQPK